MGDSENEMPQVYLWIMHSSCFIHVHTPSKVYDSWHDSTQIEFF